MQQICPLCQSTAESFYKEQFFLCGVCDGIFRPKELLPTPEAEKTRYDCHHNDADDIGYRQFVSPITEAVLCCQKVSDVGLDFGAGSGSAVAEVLREAGYELSLYDPFYHNKPELLARQYDYIVCCEVIEHFHNPLKEFELLYRLLKPSGTLYCMTYIYNPAIDFDSWYYKNDITHTFLYQKRTLEWIAERLAFSKLEIDKRLIILKK
jgi:SAM-dependent methyltransferase